MCPQSSVDAQKKVQELQVQTDVWKADYMVGAINEFSTEARLTHQRRQSKSRDRKRAAMSPAARTGAIVITPSSKVSLSDSDEERDETDSELETPSSSILSVSTSAQSPVPTLRVIAPTSIVTPSTAAVLMNTFTVTRPLGLSAVARSM